MGPGVRARSLFQAEPVITSPAPAHVAAPQPGAHPARVDVLHVMAPAEVGGPEHVAQALASGQRSAGHRVSGAAVLGEGARAHPFLGPLAAAGVDVYPLRVPLKAYFRERAAVVDICRRTRPDLVHTHGHRVDVVDAGAVRRLGIPTVTTVHGFTGGDWKNRLYERLQRRAFRRLEAVVAVSRPPADELARAGVPAARLHVVPNAWPAREEPLPRDQARQALAVPPGRFHLGWVGRLTAEKGADVLLAALGLLTDLPLVASVLGAGRERARLEAAANRQDLGGCVRWFGNRPGAGRLFSAFDAFVLSSRTEGTPIVLFEAMAARGPIVAPAVGGVPDVVSSQEALLVPPDDPAALAEAIRGVRSDPAGAAARARRARERLARAFAVGPWLARYEQIYRGVS